MPLATDNRAAKVVGLLDISGSDFSQGLRLFAVGTLGEVLIAGSLSD